MIFITQYPLFFSNFYCRHCDLESAFVWFPPPLCACCNLAPLTHPPILMTSGHLLLFFKLYLTLWNIWLGLNFLSGVMTWALWALGKYIVYIWPYMWASVWWRVTAHFTGSLSFLQMRSIEEATRGGTLLRSGNYFSITIETSTQAFSWSRPGVHWHQLSQVLTKTQMDLSTLNNTHLYSASKAMTACLHTWR